MRELTFEEKWALLDPLRTPKRFRALDYKYGMGMELMFKIACTRKGERPGRGILVKLQQRRKDTFSDSHKRVEGRQCTLLMLDYQRTNPDFSHCFSYTCFTNMKWWGDARMEEWLVHWGDMIDNLRPGVDISPAGLLDKFAECTKQSKALKTDFQEFFRNSENPEHETQSISWLRRCITRYSHNQRMTKNNQRQHRERRRGSRCNIPAKPRREQNCE